MGGAPKKAFPIYTLLLICVDAFRTAWGAIPRILPALHPPTLLFRSALVHSTRLSLSVKYLSVSVSVAELQLQSDRIRMSVCLRACVYFIIMMHAGGAAWQEPSLSSSSLTCSSGSWLRFFFPILFSYCSVLSFNLVVSVEIVHFENASITITIVVKLHRIRQEQRQRQCVWVSELVCAIIYKRIFEQINCAWLKLAVLCAVI